MSETEIQQETERAERPVLRRTYEAEFTAGDGRTVDVRIVPYGETATAADGYGGVPKGIPYQEEWMPGVFAGQAKAANRVLANFEHQPGIAGVIGHGVSLLERSDGFYGSFRMHNGPDGDKALMLVEEGVLSGVSLEVPAHSVKSVRSAAGVVQRVKGHLAGIALCRTPAYTSSVVLAVREAPENIIDEELLPTDIDPETVARCRRLGIALPQRYETHPAETDTPAESGTSEAAPVESTQNSTRSEDKDDQHGTE